MAPVKVTLSGTGDIQRQPERAVVSVTVRYSGYDRAVASEKVQTAAKEIQDAVRHLAARDESGVPTAETAIMRWSSSGLAMRTWTETFWEFVDITGITLPEEDDDDGGDKSSSKKRRKKREKTRRLYEATVQITTRFRDFEKLSSFTIDMTTKPLVTVGDVSWVLTTETQEALQTEAIKKSYANVLTKARAYADAMGLATVRPVEIDEPSAASYGFNSFGRAPAGLMMQQQQNNAAPFATGSSGNQTSLSFVPQDVSCSASCKIIFEVE